MVDRAQQALYLFALEPVAETEADPNSYGFRVSRSAADAIEQCFIALGRPECARWILEADIRSCFDEISHDWLVAHIPMDKAILLRWLKAGYLHNHVFHATEAGAASYRYRAVLPRRPRTAAIRPTQKVFACT